MRTSWSECTNRKDHDGWTQSSNQKVLRLKKYVPFYLEISSLVTNVDGRNVLKPPDSEAEDSEECLWPGFVS